MKKDPVVEEVREVRDRLAQRFDYDLHAIVEDAKKRQYQTGHRVVSFVKQPEPSFKTRPQN